MTSSVTITPRVTALSASIITGTASSDSWLTGRLSRLAQIVDQRREIAVERHGLDVVGGCEPAMDLRDGQHAAVGLLQRRPGLGRSGAVRLEMKEGRDELQRVADAVVHLAHQHLPLGSESLETVARLDDGAVGLPFSRRKPRRRRRSAAQPRGVRRTRPRHP